MKNLKIAEGVHYELGIFSRKIKENMSDIGGLAIMQYLKAHKHKFDKNFSDKIKSNNHNKK
jgi:hypothetical protein